MNPFDIFIAYISWGDAGKARPVLVFNQNDDRVSVLTITTQYESKSEFVRTKYFKINEWQQASLERPSYIDTGSMFELPKTVFDAKTPIGRLTVNDKIRLLGFLSS